MREHQPDRTGDEPRDAEPARYRVEAVARAAEALNRMGEGSRADPAEIAASLAASESFIRSALATLERRGLARGPVPGREGWSLGFGWLRLAAAARKQIDLREIAQPVMRRVRDEIDETVILAVRRGGRRINIDYCEGTQAVRRMSDVGGDTPLYAGAAGRALLAGFSPGELRGYLESIAASDGTVINAMDIDAYTRDVEAAKGRGYAVTAGEISPDLCAIASPVLDQSGGVVAALTISVPADRFSEAFAHACGAAARDGARDLSRLIGHAE